MLANDFLDLRGAISAGGERGLLGMAFAPDANTGRFFVNFTNPSGNTVVARFRRSTPLAADPATRFDLRFNGAGGAASIAQPFSNHNGGHLAFGPDGYLYIGLGDGGSGNDPDHRAQNPQDLLGKMLRARRQRRRRSRRSATRCLLTIPSSAEARLRRGPRSGRSDFATRGATASMIRRAAGLAPSSSAMSARELSRKSTTNRADRGGRNYGWRNREGAHDNVTSRPPAFTPLVDPIHEYGRSSGQSVTGGYVYRGGALGPAFTGRYFFADYVAGRVWSLALTIDSQGEARASNLIEHTSELGGQSQLGNISSFGVDADGELYIVSLTRGTILRVAGLTPPTPTGLRIVR